ncbi:hypothetical protein JIN85_07285 [Luteolibacter pohnpeiensis]|uniref:Uncharacterized protein n=1 Tax=Luteolibacter pohnpeiensis TaxID=454153 RepID=A0A934S7H2_9BACT|nr:hypothetical protein [Luteolibacter pohnpeiensis]MBK1882211.1 hypothetical protein [Luteolibacter pohnpeiensis]
MKFGIPTLIAISLMLVAMAVMVIHPFAGLFLFGAVILLGIGFLIYRIVTRQ